MDFQELDPAIRYIFFVIANDVITALNVSTIAITKKDAVPIGAMGLVGLLKSRDNNQNFQILIFRF